MKPHVSCSQSVCVNLPPLSPLQSPREMHTSGALSRAVLLSLLVLLGGAFTRAAQDSNTLRFREDGTFNIVELTDLHYGESEAKDALSDQAQDVILASERVDLAVFNGDMVTGFFWFLVGKQADGWFEERWAQLTAPVVAAGVPYAITLGNHDAEADLTRREIMELAASTSNMSLARPGPEGITGASNYWLDIYDPSGSEVAARVWFLDSMDVCQNTTGGQTL